MTSTATTSFVLDKWEPQATDEAGGTEFARVAIAKTFTGAVEGTSTVEMLTASNATSRAYVAFERLAVSVDGRKGGFVLHHTADDSGLTLKILTGSGFGELAGISGTANIEMDAEQNHTLVLTYDL
ncbi:DUF3224 domain-containing protein [Amycolatopsis sp. SID8362]|uniref:DUF3224 domain-containing protein n=1 Tax=Amycolatopsis sp. SID8362 TaxID=2690346 RepID=UPI00136ADF2A|nr:DUF3224 domain-containing protein [Amycolatopsis sp. SID8362]NBH07744.1 DUF3224 domain-containing protein [Amycolatopsis sp. SID8362]NED44439.1 DUF3224 domain-containing protein [Amycolatopsis sp. SID8362]